MSNKPSSVMILFDSKRKSSNGLKCCADSNAIIRSNDLLLNGKNLDVEFNLWIEFDSEAFN